MRNLWLFLIALSWFGYVLSTQCPSKLPKSCLCFNGNDGFRVVCSQNPNLHDVLNSIKDDTIDKLEIRNCDPKIKQLNIIPALRIRSLTISNCGIEAISGGAFNNIANNVEELNFPNNSLTMVTYLGILPKLRSLNVNNNLIVGFAEHCFDGSPQLHRIFAKNNKICMLFANSLNEVRNNLEVLNLSGNCLTTVPLNLRNAFKLSHLDLSENNIKELSQLSFANLVALKELRINSNVIPALSTLAFVNVPSLTHLYAKNNKLSKIDPNFFQSFQDLEHVDLSNNEIINIPFFRNMSKLNSVAFDHNEIRRIESQSFVSNPLLRMIMLQDNDISHVARNAFEYLDGLEELLLSNNSLTFIEDGALNGMKDLRILKLRNNYLTSLKNESLASVPNLLTADFAHNVISHIQAGSFTKQTKLMSLDLSFNNITTLDDGTFERRIPRLLLDGNKLICDNKFDWFINYVSKNQVQTTAVVGQSDVKCDAPLRYSGVPLTELNRKKANDSFTESMNTLGFGNPSMVSAGGNMIASVLPALLAGQGGGQAGGFLGAVPLLRNFPGMGFIPGEANPELDFAVERFSEPLVRIATGSKPVPGDLQQMMSTLPKLIVNIPGAGDIDLIKLNPQILEHILRGGQIPGIPREAVEKVVKQYTSKMYDAALRARSGASVEGDEKFLPPLKDFPPEVVRLLLSGKGVPYWDAAQMRVVQDYYTAQLPLVYKGGKNNTSGTGFTMFNLLPPGYNMSKIPPEVIGQILHGELPDFTKLPSDVIDYLRENGDKLFNSVNFPTSLEETLRKLPPSVLTSTAIPYDINVVDSTLLKEEGWLTSSRIRIISAAAVGLLALISLALVGGYFYYLRRKQNKDETIINSFNSSE